MVDPVSQRLRQGHVYAVIAISVPVGVTNVTAIGTRGHPSGGKNKSKNQSGKPHNNQLRNKRLWTFQTM